MKVKIYKTISELSGDLIDDITIVRDLDESGRLICETETCNVTNDTMKIISTYDGETLVASASYMNDDQISATEYAYDDNGALISEIRKAENEEILHQYEREGNVANQIIRDESGHVLESKEIHYNDQNQIIREIEDDGDYVTTLYHEGDNLVKLEIHEAGKLTLSEEYIFDDNNNEIASKGQDYESGQTVSVERVYDQDNHLIKETQLEDGDLFSTSVYKYDSEGRMLSSEISTEEEITICRYQYED